MPRVGFEPTIPVFERAKTVHALELAATVIGIIQSTDHFPSIISVSMPKYPTCVKSVGSFSTTAMFTVNK
jgi:hypothetical protein